ncbi:hypothetical protein L1987_24188 [Smallanthus sonchifolius]|uniref:Uncharacterized protein n=1 Tax=Smallanthus sonchifolius TaxID=185202 RepID=A0ACB9IJ08_9ASTR|nr:hypothetical protein L1987_24188 [Smallanthus sonchifolius]
MASNRYVPIPDIRNRNVVINRTPSDKPKSSRLNEGKDSNAADIAPKGMNVLKITNKKNDIKGRNATTKGNENKGKQATQVIETSNMYELLDEDCMEIEDGNSSKKDDNGDHGVLKELDAGWIRKQERNLNITFLNVLTQDQRLEAKRYVKDKKLPTPEVLSIWPGPLIHYFRQLSSLYVFRDGLLVTSGTCGDDESLQNHELEEDIIVVGEVESENDGTAVLMKSDQPVLTPLDMEVDVNTPMQTVIQQEKMMPDSTSGKLPPHASVGANDSSPC